MQTQSSADRITTSLSLAHQRKNKQTKTQHKSHKNSAQNSAYTNHWTNLRGQKPKGRNNSTLKPGKGNLKHNNLKKNNEKTEKYYTNEGAN